MTGFDDFHRLELDLSEVADDSRDLVQKAVEVSAMKGKKAWREKAAGHSHSGRYPYSIDYDPVDPAFFSTSLGPKIGRKSAGLGIVEDSPGGVRGTPQRNYLAAEAAIEKDLPGGIEKAIDQALRRRSL
jgi:hypothetical protein